MIDTEHNNQGTYIGIDEGEATVALGRMEATQVLDRLRPQLQHLWIARRFLQDEAWRCSRHDDGAVTANIGNRAKDTFPANAHLFRLQRRLFCEFRKARLGNLVPTQVLGEGLGSFLCGQVVWLVDHKVI